MKQKTFKEYAATKKAQLHPFTTLKHEVSTQLYPNMETVFGSHSVKELQEEVSTTPGKITTTEQIGRHSPEAEQSIHDKNKVGINDHIQNYTSKSTDINHALHTKTPDPDIKKQIKGVDKVLDAARIHEDTHVYTGLKDSPVKYFKGSGSAKVHLPAYTSTTTHYATATFFTTGKELTKQEKERHTPINSDYTKTTNLTVPKHVLKIHLPKGTNAGSVKHFSTHQEENEILLHRGHNIEIHPHPTIDKHGTHIWHARIISHTPDKV